MSIIFRRTLLSFIALSFFTTVHAAENIVDSNFTSLLNSSFVSSLSMGSSWENAGKTQTLNSTPEIIKTYAADRSTNTLPTGELFLGVRNTLSKQLETQIGLALVTAGSASLSGDVWDDADPQFNNYTYQYKISRMAFAVKGKLLANLGLPIIPWISASLGVGFNNAYGFNNTPTLYEAVPFVNFRSNTTTAFTYAIGIGFQRQLASHWQLGAGYEFSDWGKSQLGSASRESSNQNLFLSHLYTHSLIFNLTYLA